MINIKIPPKKSKSFIENFFIKKGLVDIEEKSRRANYKVNDLQISALYKPVMYDLYRLFQFNVKMYYDVISLIFLFFFKIIFYI